MTTFSGVTLSLYLYQEVPWEKTILYNSLSDVVIIYIQNEKAVFC